MNEKEKELFKQQKELAEHYKAISEIYIATYEQGMEREAKIMKAKGVVCEMYSDLLRHLKDNKETEKSKRQFQRLRIFDEVLEVFGSISSTNIQIKLLLQSHYVENYKLKNEIEELKLKCESLNSLIEATSQ